MGVIGARLKGNHVLRQIAETMLTLDQQEEPQRIVTLVDHSIANHPELIDNAFLLGKRANAKMDLAKKCLQTIKEASSSSTLKKAAHVKYNELLEEAEQDLKVAFTHKNDWESVFVDTYFATLEKMKEKRL